LPTVLATTVNNSLSYALKFKPFTKKEIMVDAVTATLEMSKMSILVLNVCKETEGEI
jgi:hypothetical protein